MSKAFYSFWTVLTLLWSLVGRAQTDGNEKYDIILKSNGQEMKGTIVEVTDDVVRFHYPKETLFYTLNKTGIDKITFANGRTEIIGATANTSDEMPADNIRPVVYQNKVGVLPASVITNFQTTEGEISNRIQLACFNALSEKAVNLIFVAPNTTNALLLKRGITGSEINRYTMEKLCQLLGVNYLVQTVATINTNAGVHSQVKVNNNDDVKSITKLSQDATDYDTNIMLNIFDRQGKKLFGKDRSSIWHTSDGYQKTINYLAKRTPLYKK